VSPVWWPSKVAKAVASSARPASTFDTQVPFGSPGTFGATFAQVAPPSRVTCRLPSSVPTQSTFGFFVDSLIAKRVVKFSALELSTVSPPDFSWCCHLGSLVVRSGEIFSHESPWSRERKRNWAPTYIVFGSFGLIRTGVFQLKR